MRTTAEELLNDFHGAVDDYLAACEAEGTKPETAYKGSLNVRLGEELHRRAAIYAIEHNQSLNSLTKGSRTFGRLGCKLLHRCEQEPA